MSNLVQLKRSSVAGRVPDAANVAVGEPVVNLTDKILYTKTGSGEIITIGAGTTSDISEGSNLYFTNARSIAALTEGDGITIDANGLVSATSTPSTTLSLLNRYEYTATAGQVVFSGSDNNSQTLNIPITSLVDVYLNGVRLIPSVDYTAYTSNITLNEATSLGENVSVITNAASGAGFVVDALTSDGGSTYNLTRTPPNAASILVTLQGVKQRPTADYSVSGNTIIFTNTPTSGDDIDVVHLASAATVIAGVSSINGMSGNVTLVAGDGIDIAANGLISAIATSSITIANTSPLLAKEGDMYWDSEIGRMFVYYTDEDSSQWVDASPSSATIPSLSLTGSIGTSYTEVFRFDPNVYRSAKIIVSFSKNPNYRAEELFLIHDGSNVSLSSNYTQDNLAMIGALDVEYKANVNGSNVVFYASSSLSPDVKGEVTLIKV